MPTRRPVVVTLCGLSLAAPGVAAADSRTDLVRPGWRPVAAGTMNPSDEAGLARTADGTLHVAWRRGASPGQDVVHTPITAGGAVGAPATVLGGWAQVTSPALAAVGDGLLAVVGGSRTGETLDPQYGLNTATSSDGGRTWAVADVAASHSPFAAASTPALAFGAGGLLAAWAGSGGTEVHPGVDPTIAAQGGFGPGIDQALVATTSGRVLAAWCDADRGVSFAAVSAATGAPAGPSRPVAGSGRCPADTRVPLTAFRKAAPGTDGATRTFLAASAADGRRVLVRGIDTAGADVEAFPRPDVGGGTKQQLALAAAPAAGDGVWVGWREATTDRLVLRRVRAGAVWGAPVTVTLPAGGSLSQLQLDAQADRVDVVVRTTAPDGSVGLRATQVRPGLTLTSPATVKAVRRKGMRVLDAQFLVGGATVRVAGRSVVSKGGVAKLDLRPGTYLARVTKPGYTGASLRVRLK